MKSLLLALLLFRVLVLPVLAGDAPPSRRLLTVGNSFADNMVRYLPDLAGAAGLSVTIGRANVSGASLQRHWEAVEAGEQGQLAKAKIYSAGPEKPARSLMDILGGGDWDFITIQQASLLSDQAGTYRPYADNLVAFLRQHAPKAVIAFHQTWAYRWDDPKFSKGGTPAEMNAAIRQASLDVARNLSLLLIPVGEAFQRAQERPEWIYSPEQGFDFHNRSPDRLPQQDGSLYVGWRWARENPTRMYLDAHHASVAGSYLAGCVLFGVVFGQSPAGNTFHPPELTAEQARSLQNVAAEVLADHKNTHQKQP